MIEILHEDNHCLVVNKPAGCPSQPDDSGDASLEALVRDDLKRRYGKPGNVYLGLIHRLDRPTSGAILLAKTSKAAARLSEQSREGRISKTYWAIVEGDVEPETGVWLDQLRPAERGHSMRIARAGTTGAQATATHYRVLDKRQGLTLLELTLITGRKHQIRVQCGSRGHPVLGDLRYGGKRRVAADDGGARIALHAREIRFKHPTREEVISVTAPVPADWPALDGHP